MITIEIFRLFGSIFINNDEANKSLSKTESQFEKLGKKLENIGDTVTKTGKNMTMKVTTPLVALGGFALKAGMDFEAAMSEVQAISGATGSELDALVEKAKYMGATTKFSASESAEALKYMAMAGWDTSQMLDGLDGVMALAAASGESLGSVSDIVTDSMTAFGLSAQQAGEFADVLAAASSKSNTNVGMLGESFKYVAPVAGALGYTVQDVSTALGLMANAGIKSSQAGTSLRTALTNMANPSKAMASAMQELGISLTDNSGQMKSLDQIMRELQVAFSGLSESQQASYAATIFGKEAMSGMLAIINTTEEDYNKLSDAIYNSAGAAQEMADIMQNNAKGGVTQLMSAVEGLAIQISDILIPHFNKAVDFIKKWVDWFASLDQGTQKTIVTIAGLAAALGPVLIVIGSLISTLANLITVIKGVSSALTLLSANPWVVAIAAAVALLVGLTVLIVKNWEPIKDFFSRLWDEIKKTFVDTWNVIKDFFDRLWTWLTDFFMKWAEVIAILNPFIGVPLLIIKHWEAVKNFFKGLWDQVIGYFQNAWDRIKGIVDNIKNAASKLPVIGGLFKGSNDSISAFARGTNYAPGGWALVGEEGPELVNLPRGSKVKTAQETEEMMGGVNIHIDQMVVRDDNDIRLISQELHRLSQQRSRSLGVR